MAIDSILDYVSALQGGQHRIEFNDFKLHPGMSEVSLEQIFADSLLPLKIARSLFGQFDGQLHTGLKLFCEFSLVSSADCIEMYGDLNEFSDMERGGPSDPRIRADTVWRSGWFPMAWNQNTNKHLCVDLDPSSLGTSGQIIFVGEWGELSVLGNSLVEFLNTIDQKLKSSNYELYKGTWNEFKGLLIPSK